MASTSSSSIRGSSRGAGTSSTASRACSSGRRRVVNQSRTISQAASVWSAIRLTSTRRCTSASRTWTAQKASSIPAVGAAIMRALFGEPWGEFVFFHSRFLARQRGRKPSPLCIADKLAITLPREIREYMAKSHRNNETGSKYASAHLTVTDEKSWHADMCEYVSRWVEEHKDGRADTWTPAPEARGAA